MSFWTGFTTGLAKSVDQGLQNAMSKRDEEMSRAKKFWMTRQAQNLDMKEAYDRRAEKALKRLIRETGSSTLGLAAFNAAGGDADGAEDFLKNVDATRNEGLTYNIRDRLKLPEGYKAGDDIAEADALKSVRMQMKGIDATNLKVDDPLSKIGLGLKGGAGQRVADEVNSLIEPEIVETLNNIPNVTIDRSGFVSAIDRKREIQNSIPGLDKQLSINTSKIVNLDKTSPTYEADLEVLEDETAKIILAKTMAREADTASTSGTKLTEFLSMSRTIKSDVDTELGYTPGGSGVAPSIANGPQGELSGDAAISYRNKIIAQRNEDFVRNNLVDKNGEPVSADADAAIRGKAAFSSIAKRVKAEALARKDDGEGSGTGTAADAKKVEIPFEKQKIAVQANPMGALTKFMKVNGAKATPDAMLNLLRKYEYSDDEAIGLIQEVMKQNQPAPKKPSFADLTKKQTSVAKVDPDPRPSGSDQASQYAANDWDNKFAATHNPDGTPK